MVMKELVDRRRFLQQVVAFAGTAVPLLLTASGCATGLTTYRIVGSSEKMELSVLDYPELQEIGGAIEIESPVLPENIIVVRLSLTTFAALSPTCTHLGCTVRKEPAFFRCPCHGSTYTLEGNVVRGPAERPLHSYATAFSGTNLTIQLGK
jgi:Rieske Fe-S protein